MATACTVGILGAVAGPPLFASQAAQGVPVTQAFSQPYDRGMGGTGPGSFPDSAIGQGFFNHGTGAISTEPAGEDGLTTDQIFDPVDDLMKVGSTPGLLDVDLYLDTRTDVLDTKTDVSTEPMVAQPVPEPSSLLILLTSLLVLPVITGRRRMGA